MRRGSAVLITIMMANLLLVMIMASWQSRLLLSVHRKQALSDSIILTYHAETEMYDNVAKFTGQYPLAFPVNFDTYHSEKIFDGTNVIADGDITSGSQILTIVANRLFASNKLQISRTVETYVDEFTQPTEIIFSLDCTGSMNEPSCSTCLNNRLVEQERAILDFIDELKSRTGHEQVKLGVSVFALTAKNLVSLGSSLTLDQIRTTVDNGFGSTVETSPACQTVGEYTSLGSGLAYMHDQVDPRRTVGTKQIEILITDGLPNQRISVPEPKYKDCVINLYCPVQDSYCRPVGPYFCFSLANY